MGAKKSNKETCVEYRGFQVLSEGDATFLRPTDSFAISTFWNHFGARAPNDRYPLKNVVIDAMSLIRKLSGDMDCEELSEFLRAKWIERSKPVLKLIEESRRIRYDHLLIWFTPGAEVYLPDAQKRGGVITSSTERKSYFGAYVQIRIRVIEQIGSAVKSRALSVNIGSYSGDKSLDSLTLSLITPEQKRMLTERGRVFRELVSDGKPKYRSYRGQMNVNSFWGARAYRADGRIMVDAAGLQRFDDKQQEAINYETEDCDDRREGSIEISDDLLWQCSPVVYGYSLVSKGWGAFLVQGITPVAFRHKAIEQLVMEPKRKALLRALVQHGDDSFSDVIEGKGGGRIILLAGSPGVGKTLTAEAMAEALQRPLYSISVGELGTTPSEVETSLREILELATTWNAVLLLDEADIFLERRTSGDILRNALVGVFLRLLEYHQGVLFLTSNRVKDFDLAFASRISVTLHYPEMDHVTRRQIWENLLNAAGITTIDMEAAARLGPLNGRQIKNTIRCAAILAKSRGVAVSLEHVSECVQLLDDDGVEHSRTNGHSKPSFEIEDGVRAS